MMTITNLFVHKYKNIQAGLLVFPKCGYTALVGENGSGKRERGDGYLFHE